MKKIILIALIFTFSCSKNNKEVSSPSSRIDNVQSGSDKIFKDIDE